jgi:Protein of unknown function (DUF2442)
MVARLIAAWPLERYQVWLAFADGIEGAVDLEDRLPTRWREPLREPAVFRRVGVDRARNSLRWPNGVGLDVALLYRELRHRQYRHLGP